MGKVTIKHVIIISFLAYSTIEIHEINTRFGAPPSDTVDVIMMIVFSVCYLLYYLSTLRFIMTPSRINKINNDTRLEYDIIVSSDGKTMEKMYVRPCGWNFTWYELDYPFTLHKGSSIDKCKFFIKKFPTAVDLKGWMNKRILLEKCINRKYEETTEFWWLFVGLIITFGFYIGLFLLIHYEYNVQNYYF